MRESHHPRAVSNDTAMTTGGIIRYRGMCGLCHAEVFTSAERVGDGEVSAILEHVWDMHPDVVQRPHVLPLGDLMRLVHVRMS